MKISNLNKIVVMLLLTIIAPAILISGCGNKETTGKSEGESNIKKDSSIKQVVYTCPMHPEVKSMNKDDKCPKCGMNLEEMKQDSENKK